MLEGMLHEGFVVEQSDAVHVCVPVQLLGVAVHEVHDGEQVAQLPLA